MTNSGPIAETTVIVRFDPRQGVDTSYHYDRGQLVVTFGPATGDVGQGVLSMVMRCQVEPGVAE